MRFAYFPTAAILALAACAPNVVRTHGSGATTSGAASGTGSGGGAGTHPACLGRITSSAVRPTYSAVFSSKGNGQHDLYVTSIDVDASGEVAFVGQILGSGPEVDLNGASIGACPSGYLVCDFVGMLHTDGSVSWAHVFGDFDGGGQPVVRFRGDAIEMVGEESGFSAPFPTAKPAAFDPFFARFNHDGTLASYVPFGSMGTALPIVVSETPMADGGTLISGYFLNGWMTKPTGTFVGCGAMATLDHPRSFVARLAPGGICSHFDVIGSNLSVTASMGASEAGDLVTLSGAYAGDLTLGGSTVNAPTGGYAAFLAIGQATATGETWSKLTSNAPVQVSDWSGVADLFPSRDGTTVAGAVGGKTGLDFIVADTKGAFTTTFGVSAGAVDAWAAVGVSPSGLVADRPIAFFGNGAGGPVSLGSGGGITAPFLALFDGAGVFCAARTMDLTTTDAVVEPSSVVVVGRLGATATIRRVELTDLAG